MEEYGVIVGSDLTVCLSQWQIETDGKRSAHYEIMFNGAVIFKSRRPAGYLRDKHSAALRFFEKHGWKVRLSSSSESTAGQTYQYGYIVTDIVEVEGFDAVKAAKRDAQAAYTEKKTVKRQEFTFDLAREQDVKRKKHLDEKSVQHGSMTNYIKYLIDLDMIKSSQESRNSKGG